MRDALNVGVASRDGSIMIVMVRVTKRNAHRIGEQNMTLEQCDNNLKYNPNIKTTCKKCGSDNIHERIGGWRGLKDNSISINEGDGFSLYELFTCGDCMEECDIEQKTKVEETTK